LVDAYGKGFILDSVLALNYQYRNAVDEEDHILTVGVPPIVEAVFFCYFINIMLWIIIINQRQVDIPVFRIAEKCVNLQPNLDRLV
jgi:hypothetical protein